MRGQLKKALSLLCVFLLVLSSTVIVPNASGEELNPDASEVERDYDPGTNNGAEPDSGLFIITGTDDSLGAAPVSGEKKYSSIPETLGQDVTTPGEETLSASGAAPDDTLGSSVVTPEAKPSITVSQSSLSLKTGETMSVTVTVSNYPAGAYLQASNGNAQAFSCVWGNWSGASIPLRVTGKNSGNGKITFNLKDTKNQTLVSATLDITVLKSQPTLSVEPASVSLDAGTSKSVTVTVRNYDGGGSVSALVEDSSVCEATPGGWSGWTFPVTVSGKAAGNTKVTVTLYNSLRTPLASVSFSVSVSDSKPVSLTIAPNAPTLNAGESSLLTVSVNGSVSEGDYLQYSASNPTAFGAAWSGKWDGSGMKLNLTGRNAGSGTLTVALKNQAGKELAKSSVQVDVQTRNDPKITVAPSSVSVKAGKSVDVRCTGQNINDSFCFRYVNRAPSVLQCSWKSDWSGNSLPLTIKGKAAGSGFVTVELLVNNVIRSSATIAVEVLSDGGGGDNGGGGGGGDNGGGQTGQFSAYGFSNYSRPHITLALCQYMFGKTQRAKTVYDWDIGNGGVCFGMSTTVGLLNASSKPNADTFGKNLISQLQKSDYASDLGLSLSDFIEALHVSQVAYSMKESSGLSNLVQAVREGGVAQPVIVCIRGPGGGHALVGYGVTSSGSVRVYDSNWPGQERTVSISGSTWSYKLWEGLTWNSSNGKITYIPYSVYSSVWNQRGTLNGVRLQDGGPLKEDDRCLLTASVDDFTLLDFTGEVVMAQYVDGVLQDNKSPDVEEVFLDNALPDGAFSHVHMLYVPADLYTVRNDSGKKMDVSLSGMDLSVRVSSEAEEFDLAVSDAEEFANAMILGLEEGQEYSISIGSSRDGDPDETTIAGAGNKDGETICLGMGESFGIGMEGLYISNGVNDGMLSLGELEDTPGGGEEGAPQSAFVQSFTLNSVNLDTEYSITAEAGRGGTVSPAGVTSVREGESYTYRIQPSEGYTLKAIYVNGVEAVYSDEESDAPQYLYDNGAYEYTFRDVTEAGNLYAEFSKDLSGCLIHTENEGELVVTVTDPDRESGEQTLTEGVDYNWSLSAAVEDGEPQTYLVIEAVSGSDYSGGKMEVYTYHIDEEPTLKNGLYDAASEEIRLTVANADAFALMVAAYAAVSGDANQTGKLLTVFPADKIQTSEKTEDGTPVRISLDGAGLPETYVVRAFLLSDLENLRVMAQPLTIPVSS